jgi:SAM-dependent methyltransferase
MTATFLPTLSRMPAVSPMAQCLYCGGTDLQPHFDDVRDRLGFVPGTRTFEKCLDCQSLRLSPFPSEEEIPGFYPPVYSFSLDLGGGSAWRKSLAALEYRFFYGPQYQAQARQVLKGTRWAGETGLRMLDVGCGRGLRLRAFAERGFQVHGLDLQPEVVDYVTRLGFDATLGGIDCLESTFQAESFDLITAFYLLEHVPDVQDVLTRCLSLLRPGGWFVGVVPICDGLQARLFGKRWIHVTEAPRHLSLPSTRGLLGAAKRSGYVEGHIRPDSALNCAGIVGGSLLPGSDLTTVYGTKRWIGPMVRRLIGAGCAVAAIPFCLAENYLLGQTSHGMLMARKQLVRE